MVSTIASRSGQVSTLEDLAARQCRQLLASWGHDPDAVLRTILTLQKGRAWFLDDIALIATPQGLLPPHIGAQYARKGTPGNPNCLFSEVTRLTGIKFARCEEGSLGVYRAAVIGTHDGATQGGPTSTDIILRVSGIPEECFEQ